MTDITAVYGADTLRLTARGHATGAPAACAAVSALLYALEGWAGETEGTPVGNAVLSVPLPRQSTYRRNAGDGVPYALEGWAEDAAMWASRPTGEDAAMWASRPTGEGAHVGRHAHMPAKPLARVAPGAADFALPRTAETEAAFDLTVTGLARVAATAPAAVRIAIEGPASSRETP